MQALQLPFRVLSVFVPAHQKLWYAAFQLPAPDTCVLCGRYAKYCQLRVT